MVVGRVPAPFRGFVMHLVGLHVLAEPVGAEVTGAEVTGAEVTGAEAEFVGDPPQTAGGGAVGCSLRSSADDRPNSTRCR